MITPFLERYGYLAVFFTIFLEDFGVPLPGETTLIAASVLASQGRLSVFLVAAVAVLGAVLGDNVGYAIGRFGGRALVLRFGRYVFITKERLDHVEGFFTRRGSIVIIVARFIEVLRQLNGIAAGLARLPWPRFLLYNAVGAVLWVGFWCTLFYRLGTRAEQILAFYKQHELLALLVLAVVIGVVVGLRFWRRRRAARLPRR